MKLLRKEGMTKTIHFGAPIVVTVAALAGIGAGTVIKELVKMTKSMTTTPPSA